MNVWDVRRPTLPLAMFAEHRDVTTALAWHADPDVFLSTSRVRYCHILVELYDAEMAGPLCADRDVLLRVWFRLYALITYLGC